MLNKLNAVVFFLFLGLGRMKNMKKRSPFWAHLTSSKSVFDGSGGSSDQSVAHVAQGFHRSVKRNDCAMG